MKYLTLLFLLSLGLTSFAQQKDFSVYIFVAEKCPISIYMAKPLQAAFDKHHESIDFYAVFPLKNSTEETASRFLKQHDLEGFTIKLDKYQGFAKKLNATITPEAIVLDKNGNVVYQGRISNAYKAPGKMKHGMRKNELLYALNRLMEGAEIPKPWASAVGCYITFRK